MDEKKNEIILFENQGVRLEVNLKDETVWLTQKQMAELFGKARRTITRHIQNIYKDEELSESSVCSFFEHTAEDGKKYNVQYYNLDMIISVGYRVKSQNGILFRKWATSVLKDYMLIGNIYQSFARTGYLQMYRRKRSKFLIFNSKKSCICRWKQKDCSNLIYIFFEFLWNII